MANKNFNGPDQTPRLWSTGDMVPMWYPSSSIQRLPLAQVCKKDGDAQWVGWLEQLYKLEDKRNT